MNKAATGPRLGLPVDLDEQHPRVEQRHEYREEHTRGQPIEAPQPPANTVTPATTNGSVATCPSATLNTKARHRSGAISGQPFSRSSWIALTHPQVANRLDPDALLDSMKAGRYYSTQGPELLELLLDGGRLRVETSEAYAISLTGGGDRWQWGSESHGGVGVPITEAEFDLAPFRGSYCRITVVDQAGRRAWSNPV